MAVDESSAKLEAFEIIEDLYVNDTMSLKERSEERRKVVLGTSEYLPAKYRSKGPRRGLFDTITDALAGDENAIRTVVKWAVIVAAVIVALSIGGSILEIVLGGGDD